MKKIKAVFYLGLLLVLVYSADAYASEYTRPELRIVIDGNVVGAEIDVKDNRIYVSAREVGKALNKPVYWTASRGLVMIEDRKITAQDYYIKNSKAMIDLNQMLKDVQCRIEFYGDYNVLAISTINQSEDLDLYHVLPDFTSYSREDLEWLAKIVHAEAQGEPYDAKIAVGSVILNRVNSSMYPNTIKEVIFDSNSGIQFTPTINGSIYNTPSLESWLAAFEVLEGRHNAGDALFFMNPRVAKSSWVSNNREYAFTMKNHDFFY